MPHPHRHNTSSDSVMTPRLTRRRQFLCSAGIAFGGVSTQPRRATLLGERLVGQSARCLAADSRMAISKIIVNGR